ncbi:MAG: TonB-dependent receptor, partial [Saprospiraceae bacterium]|nr:TonB-dependent receptor [Saprospiraceae bacterium]
DHSFVRTVVSASYTGNTYTSEDLTLLENGKPFQLNDVKDALTTYRISSFYNNKLNNRLTLRTGFLLQNQHLDTYINTRENQLDYNGDGSPDWVAQRDFDGAFNLLEVYAQTQYRLTEQLTLNAGLHGQYFDETEDFVLEPRAAINWKFSPRQSLNFGYGMHNQQQPLPVFFFRERQPDGSYLNNNANLEFTRNQHLVLGYDFKPAADWHVKLETYYQWLDKVPVETATTSFSLLNAGADFIFPDKGSLVNEGTGTNVGLELTAEKFFSHGYYAMVTVSLFDSKYKGSDGMERNTAFNGKYVANVLAGKEFKLGSTGRRFLTLDTKATFAGGRPYTPVDLEASRLAGKEVLYDNLAFSEKLDDYFRWDVKIGFRMNSSHRKLSQTFFLDFQNVTNHENIFAMRYNEVKGNVGRINQIGFFPDILYRVEF